MCTCNLLQLVGGTLQRLHLSAAKLDLSSGSANPAGSLQVQHGHGQPQWRGSHVEEGRRLCENRCEM